MSGKGPTWTPINAAQCYEGSTNDVALPTTCEISGPEPATTSSPVPTIKTFIYTNRSSDRKAKKVLESVKEESREAQFGECWHCTKIASLAEYQVIPNIAKYRRYYQRGLFNFGLGELCNRIVLCQPCGNAFGDSNGAGCTLLPVHLDFFIRYEEQDFRRRQAELDSQEEANDIPPRRCPTNTEYREICKEGQAPSQTGPIYKKFHLKRFLPELTLGQYPLPRIQIWHGAPMAAVVHAMAAILDNDSLSTAVVEPWIKEQLVQLKNLYKRKLAPRLRRPEREEKELKLKSTIQALEMPPLQLGTPLPPQNLLTPSTPIFAIASPNLIHPSPAVRSPTYIDNRTKAQLVMTSNDAASPSHMSPQWPTPLSMTNSPFPSPTSVSSSAAYYSQHPNEEYSTIKPHSAAAEPTPISHLAVSKTPSKPPNPFIGPIWPATIPVGPSPMVWESQRSSSLTAKSQLSPQHSTKMSFSGLLIPNPALTVASSLSTFSSTPTTLVTSPTHQTHPPREATARLKSDMQAYERKAQENVLLMTSGVQAGTKRRLLDDKSSENVEFYDPIRETKSPRS